MTLHWWMHWFWVTYQICACFCAVIPSPMHSISEKTHGSIRISNGSESIRYTASLRNFTNASLYFTTETPIRLRRPSKKQETLVTTTGPIVKATTVINYNNNASLYSAENQSSVNISFEAISRMDNISHIDNGNGESQNLIVSSERFGEKRGYLSAASITGITLGSVSIIGIICAVSFILYRSYGINRPQVLNDHCSNPDSSGYIDDSSVRREL